MKTIEFEKDQKVMSIDFETLKESADYDRGKKFPKSHFEVIEDIMSLMSEEHHYPELVELFIAKNGVIYPKEREVSYRNDIDTIYDTRGVQITNLIAKINMLGNLTNDTSSQSLAISFNKSGIEFAFGANVSVCGNMTIFGEDHLQNYGKDSIDYEKMWEIIILWIKTAEHRRNRDLAIIEKMKLITFPNVLEEVRNIIGYFHEMFIRDANACPLRQGRINDVHRGLIAGYEEAIENQEAFNLWDMFNVFTQVSSHQDVIENRIANTTAIGKYFIDRYNLDEKEDIVVIPNKIADNHVTVEDAVEIKSKTLPETSSPAYKKSEDGSLYEKISNNAFIESEEKKGKENYNKQIIDTELSGTPTIMKSDEENNIKNHENSSTTQNEEDDVIELI